MYAPCRRRRAWEGGGGVTLFYRHMLAANLVVTALLPQAFMEKVVEECASDTDYVWIHDYHLLVLPSLLRKRFNKIRCGSSSSRACSTHCTWRLPSEHGTTPQPSNCWLDAQSAPLQQQWRNDCLVPATSCYRCCNVSAHPSLLHRLTTTFSCVHIAAVGH